MKYPKSKKSCKLYAEWLSKLHNKIYFPIERWPKLNNKYAINFAAVDEEELPYYLVDSWEVLN